MTTVRPAGAPVTEKGRVAALVLATAGFAAGFWVWAPLTPFGPDDKEPLGLIYEAPDSSAIGLLLLAVVAFAAFAAFGHRSFAPHMSEAAQGSRGSRNVPGDRAER